MIHRIPFILIALLIPCSAIGNAVVELDLDGQFGNGPDTLYSSPGDTVEVNIWYVDAWLQSFCVSLCSPENLTYVTSYPGPSAGSQSPICPVTDPPENCQRFTGGYFAICCPDPGHIYSVLYEVVETQGSGGIDVDLESSCYGEPSMFADRDQSFAGFIGAVVIGEPTATDEATWGTIKTLFR